MTGAMRVQRHEFANRLHIATGLIDAGRASDAREFLAEQVRRGPIDFAVERLDLVEDPFLQSILGAKALEAGERGVALRVAEETFLHGSLTDVEDVVAVLGNLVDNAVSAAVRGAEPREVEVALLGAGDELVITVSDSGDGIAPGIDVFQPAPAGDAEPDRVHGLGVGLPLSRELARRRGGDLWVIDVGGHGHGAVVAARMPGVLAPPHTSVDQGEGPS
jgi:two-component system CitB family sensor kinase